MSASVSVFDIIIIVQLINELYNRRLSFLSMFERSQNAIIIVTFIWKRSIKKLTCAIVKSFVCVWKQWLNQIVSFWKQRIINSSKKFHLKLRISIYDWYVRLSNFSFCEIFMFVDSNDRNMQYIEIVKCLFEDKKLSIHQNRWLTITIIQQLKNVVIKNCHEKYVFICEQKILQVSFIKKCLNDENKTSITFLYKRKHKFFLLFKATRVWMTFLRDLKEIKTQFFFQNLNFFDSLALYITIFLFNYVLTNFWRKLNLIIMSTFQKTNKKREQQRFSNRFKLTTFSINVFFF